MSTQTVSPPQPNAQTYSIFMLERFPHVTRISNPLAPPHNPAMNTKDWIGVGDPTGASYLTGNMNPDGTAERKPVLGSDGKPIADPEWSALNIPGLGSHFPVYSPAPSNVTVGGQANSSLPIVDVMDAAVLVQKIQSNIGPTHSVSMRDASNDHPPFVVIYGATETRRLWQLVIDGAAGAYAGELLIEQNAQGVGYPGNWVINADKSCTWVPAADAVTLPSIPDPMRALLPNERAIPAPLGAGACLIERTDLPTPSPGGGTDPNTPEILRLMRLLAAKFGIQ